MPNPPGKCKSNQRRAALVIDPSFQRSILALDRLGPRALAELLAEIAVAHEIEADIRRRLEDYGRASPELLKAIGADRFPPTIWRAA